MRFGIPPLATQETTPTMLTDVPHSKAAEIAWPALPDTTGASVLALQFQLDRTQFWPPERLREI